jgi:tetratricopeptide (TPR) repeat protein
VDGTKIQAKASTRTAWRKEKLEKFLVRVDQKVAALEAEIAGHEEGDDDGYRLKKELTEEQALRSVIQEKLQVLSSHQRTEMNPNEPAALLVKTSSGTRFGYNGQMVADDKHGLIVAEQLLTEPFDQGALMPVLDRVEEQLGRIAEHTVADGGYNTEQTLVEAQERSRSITVAAGPADAESHRDEPYHPSRFTYDAENDQFVCPRGEHLGFAYQELGQFDKAISLYQDVLQIQKERLAVDDPELLATTTKLAWAFNMSGQTEKALVLFQDVLRLVEAKIKTSGPLPVKLQDVEESSESAVSKKPVVPLVENTFERLDDTGHNQKNVLVALNNLAATFRRR